MVILRIKNSRYEFPNSIECSVKTNYIQGHFGLNLIKIFHISTISACDACLILENLSTSTFNANTNFGIYKFLHEHQDPYCIRFEGWFVMSL